ncbi:MAG: hypothetical protein KAJ66_02665 [Candidatus Omnitrophica bacterium]|nr:hypothetical protein [Candidatus Omnitrophota bacterium]
MTDKIKELREVLVKHFRDNREKLRRKWVKEMTAKGFLDKLSHQETETESEVIYDTCIDCLAEKVFGGAEKYARAMAEKGVLKAMTSEEIVGGMLTLRDVYGRSLFDEYQNNQTVLYEALAIYEPVADKILSIVAMAFVEEKTRGLEELKSKLEIKVKERTKELEDKVRELEKFSRLTVGRELKMMELKKKMEELEK